MVQLSVLCGLALGFSAPAHAVDGCKLLLCMAGATVLGYEFSERLLPLAGDRLIAGMQGVIIGTIVPSLVFRGHVHRHPE